MNSHHSDKPGNSVVVKRLSEALFVLILSQYISTQPQSQGLIAALKDNRICYALNDLHTHYSDSLSVDGLATTAGMSRSMFALRFKELLGISPMHYLTKWRMLKAQDLQKNPDNSIERVANKVGYASEAAFNRAFRREFNITPRAYKRVRHPHDQHA